VDSGRLWMLQQGNERNGRPNTSMEKLAWNWNQIHTKGWGVV
jgi:hypothetical protein